MSISVESLSRVGRPSRLVEPSVPNNPFIVVLKDIRGPSKSLRMDPRPLVIVVDDSDGGLYTLLEYLYS